MKKKIALACLIAAASAVPVGVSSTAFAVCNDGTSQARDYSGHPDSNPNYGRPTHEDDIAQLPNGTLIYGDGAEENFNPGYIGATGSTGYIELYADNAADPSVQVDGSTSGGETEGRVGFSLDGGPDACLNSTEIL